MFCIRWHYQPRLKLIAYDAFSLPTRPDLRAPRGREKRTVERARQAEEFERLEITSQPSALQLIGYKNAGNQPRFEQRMMPKVFLLCLRRSYFELDQAAGSCIQQFRCANCRSVQAKVISFKLGKPSPKRRVEVLESTAAK